MTCLAVGLNGGCVPVLKARLPLQKMEGERACVLGAAWLIRRQLPPRACRNLVHPVGCRNWACGFSAFIPNASIEKLRTLTHVGTIQILHPNKIKARAVLGQR